MVGLLEERGLGIGHRNIIEINVYGTVMFGNLMVFVGDHAILPSSVLSLSIRDRREQSKNSEPAKICNPPRMVWSVS